MFPSTCAFTSVKETKKSLLVPAPHLNTQRRAPSARTRGSACSEWKRCWSTDEISPWRAPIHIHSKAESAQTPRSRSVLCLRRKLRTFSLQNPKRILDWIGYFESMDWRLNVILSLQEG